MAKRLGRGMNALLKKETTIVNTDDKNEDFYDANSKAILDVKIDDIKPNKNQPRSYFNEEKLSELAQSIKNQGILQPLLVVKKESDYFLVAGERRLRAAKKAGLKTVPVIIISLSEEEIFEAALVENLQRENLNPIETALSFKTLLRIKNLTHLELSEQIGVSRSVITNALRLLTLPQNIQEALEKNDITYSHARELLSITNEKEQQEYFKKIIENNMSVHSFTLKKAKDKIKNTQTNKISDKNFLEYQNTLIEYFGTNVDLSGSFDNGSIKIEFYNQEDFARIINLLQIKTE